MTPLAGFLLILLWLAARFVVFSYGCDVAWRGMASIKAVFSYSVGWSVGSVRPGWVDLP